MPENTFRHDDHLFFGYEDRIFFEDINKELVGTVVRQHVLYYKINIEATDFDDVYGETRNKVFYPPQEIECLVDYSRKNQTNEITVMGNEITKTITVSISLKKLEEIAIEPVEGDYMQYGENFYEIDKFTYQHYHGQPQNKLGVVIEAHQIRLSEIPAYMTSDDDKEYTQQIEFTVERFTLTAEQVLTRTVHLSNIPIVRSNMIQVQVNDSDSLTYNTDFILDNLKVFFQTSYTINEDDIIVISYLKKKD